MNFPIKVPPGFDFRRTLSSHDWCDMTHHWFKEDV